MKLAVYILIALIAAAYVGYDWYKLYLFRKKLLKPIRLSLRSEKQGRKDYSEQIYNAYQKLNDDKLIKSKLLVKTRRFTTNLHLVFFVILLATAAAYASTLLFPSIGPVRFKGADSFLLAEAAVLFAAASLNRCGCISILTRLQQAHLVVIEEVAAERRLNRR